MKKLSQKVFGRIAVTAVLILLQLGLIMGVMVSLSGFRFFSNFLRFLK